MQTRRLIAPQGRTIAEFIRDGVDAWAAPINYRRDLHRRRWRMAFTNKEWLWIAAIVPFSIASGLVAGLIVYLLRGG